VLQRCKQTQTEPDPARASERRSAVSETLLAPPPRLIVPPAPAPLASRAEPDTPVTRSTTSTRPTTATMAHPAQPSSHRPQHPSSSSAPTDTMTSRLDVINSAAGRILCVADVRGALPPPSLVESGRGGHGVARGEGASLSAAQSRRGLGCARRVLRACWRGSGRAHAVARRASAVLVLPACRRP